MRVVVDTNIFINGIFTQGQNATDVACKRLIQAIKTGTLIPVATNVITAEYVYMMTDRFFKARLPEKQLKSMYAVSIRKIIETLEFVNGSMSIPDSWLTDPDDKIFIECAAIGGVEIIISDDHSLKNFETYNTTNANTDALQFVQHHNLEFYSPVSFTHEFLQSTD